MYAFDSNTLLIHCKHIPLRFRHCEDNVSEIIQGDLYLFEDMNNSFKINRCAKYYYQINNFIIFQCIIQWNIFWIFFPFNCLPEQHPIIQIFYIHEKYHSKLFNL